ncbi:hypothetical protein [Azospirillum sp. sgz301742]
MTRSGLLHSVAACAAFLAFPAMAAPLERTDPQHLAPLPPGGYDLPLSPPVVHFPMPPQWVTIRSDLDWRKAGTFDKKLTDACAARNFVEKQALRFRAVYKGEVLGVAFGHGLNLHDPGKLANPKMIYLFRNGDSTQCAVLSMRNEDRAVSGLPAPTSKRR